MITVAVLIFDDVEVLDFAGPFEVFGVTGGADRLYEVFTVAQFARPVIARNQLSINPTYCFETMPAADVLVIPGGYGTRREKNSAAMQAFVRERAAAAQTVVSVGSGALVLAKAGLLCGLQTTTHRGALAELAVDEPNCRILHSARVVDNGKFILSAGGAMGIDAALYTVAKHHGLPLAVATAAYMEYDWNYRVVDGVRIVLADQAEEVEARERPSAEVERCESSRVSPASQ